MMIKKNDMTKQEMKETEKRNRNIVSSLQVGKKVKHKGKTEYIAIIEKTYKNGKVDLKVVSENDKQIEPYRTSFWGGTLNKFSSVLYSFDECYELQ